MRKNLSKMFFGIAVVAAGIIFLGSAFGFWEISELSGWWTVFIIVPAIGSMIASGLDLLNVAAFAVGVWLLIKCNPQWVPAERMNHFAIAIALVTVGFWLIFSTVKTKKLKKHLDDNSGPISQESKPTYTAVCSGGVYKNTTGNLLGAHCFAILGGLEVDLSEAQINEEITISVTSILAESISICPRMSELSARTARACSAASTTRCPRIMTCLSRSSISSISMSSAALML